MHQLPRRQYERNAVLHHLAVPPQISDGLIGGLRDGLSNLHRHSCPLCQMNGSLRSLGCADPYAVGTLRVSSDVD